MMSDAKPVFKKWVYPVAAAGFAVFILYLFVYGNFGGVISLLSGVNPGYLILAFACVLGSVTFNSLSWHYILKNVSVQTRFRKVFSLSLVGNFVDSFVPGGWAGDIFKGFLLAKDRKGVGARTASSIILKNLLELIVTLAALVAGMVLLALNYRLDSNIMIALGAVMFLFSLPLIIILYFSTHIQTAKRVMGAFKKLSSRIIGKSADSPSGEGKLQSQLQDFHDGVMTLKTNPRGLAKPMIFQSVAWVFDVMVLFAVFAALNYIVGPDKLVITNTLVVGLQTQGVAFAGFAQVVSSTVYTVLGISPILAIASSLLAGFATFWFKMAVSFFAFQRTMFAQRMPQVVCASAVDGDTPAPLTLVNAET